MGSSCLTCHEGERRFAAKLSHDVQQDVTALATEVAANEKYVRDVAVSSDPWDSEELGPRTGVQHSDRSRPHTVIALQGIRRPIGPGDYPGSPTEDSSVHELLRGLESARLLAMRVPRAHAVHLQRRRVDADDVLSPASSVACREPHGLGVEERDITAAACAQLACRVEAPAHRPGHAAAAPRLELNVCHGNLVRGRSEAPLQILGVGTMPERLFEAQRDLHSAPRATAVSAIWESSLRPVEAALNGCGIAAWLAFAPASACAYSSEYTKLRRALDARRPRPGTSSPPPLLKRTRQSSAPDLLTGFESPPS